MTSPIQPFPVSSSYLPDVMEDEKVGQRVTAAASAALNSVANRDLVEEFGAWLDYLPVQRKGDLIKKSLEELQGDPLYVHIVQALFETHPDLNKYLTQTAGIFSLNNASVQMICDYLIEKGSLPANIDLSIVATKKSGEPGLSETELTEAILGWANNPASNEDKYIIHNDGAHFSLFYFHKDNKKEISLFHLDSLGFYSESDETNLYLVEKALDQLEKSGQTVMNYVFSMKRQNSYNTCSIFTLRDLVATARNPLSVRKAAKESLHATVEEGLLQVLYFNNLPPDLAKSTDSVTYLNEYREEFGNPKVHTKKTKTGRTSLHRFMKLHQKTHPKSGKIQNGYTSSRQIKYGHVVIKRFFDQQAATSGSAAAAGP